MSIVRASRGQYVPRRGGVASASAARGLGCSPLAPLALRLGVAPCPSLRGWKGLRHSTRAVAGVSVLMVRAVTGRSCLAGFITSGAGCARGRDIPPPARSAGSEVAPPQTHNSRALSTSAIVENDTDRCSICAEHSSRTSMNTTRTARALLQPYSMNSPFSTSHSAQPTSFTEGLAGQGAAG